MELVFDCLDVAPDRFAAAPTLVARIRIAETSGETIHSIGLRAQIRIEPQLRSYTDAQKAALYDVFGEPRQWGDTLRPIQFANVSHSVQGFSGSTEIGLPIPCSYDLEVAYGRFFDALDDGEIPMLFLFSGSVFVRGSSGFEVIQVPWDKEATFRFPAHRWRQLVDLYFPGQGWLRLDTETIEALGQFKAKRGLPTWGNTIDALLKEVDG